MAKSMKTFTLVISWCASNVYFFDTSSEKECDTVTKLQNKYLYMF